MKTQFHSGSRLWQRMAARGPIGAALRVIAASAILAGSEAAADVQSDILGAAPGATVLVACGSYPQAGNLLIDRPITLRGDDCGGLKPVLSFGEHGIVVKADDVTIEGLHLSSTGATNLLVQVPEGAAGGPSDPTGQGLPSWGNLTIRDSILEGSRRAIFVNLTTGLTVTDNAFINQLRDSIFVAEFHGALTITGNSFASTTGSSKFILIESSDANDVADGAVIITGNDADGGGFKANFFVYNSWAEIFGSAAFGTAYPGILPVSLEVSGNAIRNLTSNAIAIFFPADFTKLSSVNFDDNDIYDSGRGVVIDYAGATSIPANGQIHVSNNVFCHMTSAPGLTNIQVGSEPSAIVVKDPPPGATTDVFSPGGAIGVAAVNYDCAGRPDLCVDTDGDALCDEDDNCPDIANADQADADGDSLGDACDACPNDAANDADADGLCADADNCPDIANSEQTDTDQDALGDACDPDLDNDGVDNEADNCPFDVNPDQADFDNDGSGNLCDNDDDNDGVTDSEDACPGVLGDTAGTDVVDATGCTIADLCPCNNAWKNHGAYVTCVVHTTADFLDAGLIDQDTRSSLISQAGSSSCGQKKK